jgi:hypothetical protein
MGLTEEKPLFDVMVATELSEALGASTAEESELRQVPHRTDHFAAIPPGHCLTRQLRPRLCTRSPSAKPAENGANDPIASFSIELIKSARLAVETLIDGLTQKCPRAMQPHLHVCGRETGRARYLLRAYPLDEPQDEDTRRSAGSSSTEPASKERISLRLPFASGSSPASATDANSSSVSKSRTRLIFRRRFVAA